MSHTYTPYRQLDMSFRSLTFWQSLFEGFISSNILAFVRILNTSVGVKIKSSSARTELSDITSKSTRHVTAKKLLHADPSPRGQFHLNLPFPTYDPFLK